MTAVRSAGLDRVLDLARRLAEEFDSVPLPIVSRAVRSAADSAQLSGDDVVAALPTVERIARETLTAVRDAVIDLAGDTTRV